MAEIYIPTEQYRAAVNAIAAATNVDPDEIKIALGEEGNIWPASIRAMPAHSEKQRGPDDKEEADLLEDGDAPTPDPDFIDEGEDAKPKGVVQ